MPDDDAAEQLPNAGRGPVVRKPEALGRVGGTLHDWMNTGFLTLVAGLYLARCEGLTLGDLLGLVLP
jgi:hypothetical protein